MTLPAPNLDDRTFQDLVREARSMIPRYCPEWTDHNLSDPGITLIELFAWMVETLLYRLNKVPDKNYIKFMELIGVRLAPPIPARADVTFRLSAAQSSPVTIPKGTEVATVRTETQEAVVFTTDEDLTITPPVLEYAFTTTDGTEFTDCLQALQHPEKVVSIFEKAPQPGNALYLGFRGDLSTQALLLNFRCRSEGIGVDPNDPPLAWEYWDYALERWAQSRVEKDTTGGLNTDGHVLLHIPRESIPIEVNGLRATWIRCRAVEPRPGQSPYVASPRITTVTPTCMGGTVSAINALRFKEELLGKTNGTPAQKFVLRNTPVLTREPGETIEVETEDGRFEPWQEVPDFSGSGPDHPHFTCDSISGLIGFGPSIKQPTGEERQYGRIPPAGRQVRFTTYRAGGGVIGNVGERTINVMKTSIPYVAGVTNFEPARGGTDAETIDRAKLRAPQILRSRTRAVTAEDFEYLAIEASPLAARAKCIAAGTPEGASLMPGIVRVHVIPHISATDGPIPEEELQLTRPVREAVQSYLDERKLLGTRLDLAAPRYLPLKVQTTIRAMPMADPEQVKAQIEKRLYRYIHPVCGGSEGTGWPFGHGPSLSEIYSVIQGTPGVGYVEDARLIPIDPESGEPEAAITQMDIPPDSVMCSARHEITVR